MLPVEIYPIQDAMVLRARGSELLILANHVAALKNLKSAGDFAKYFLDEALVNRPARKLFEAWLRKDGSLWSRIYKTVQTIEANSSLSGENQAAPSSKVPTEAKAQAEVKPTSEVKAKAEKTPAKKSDKKDEKKEEKTSAAAKPAAKPAAKAAPKSEAKKAAPKATAKPAVKPSTKSAAKPVAKTATRKTGKK